MAPAIDQIIMRLTGDPLLLFAAIVVLSLAQEDLASATAATLAAADPARLPLLWLAAATGLLLGDNGLYGAGRLARRNAWLKARLHADRLRRLWRFVDESGARLVITARFLPGTRLLTYLACGFRPLAWPRFLLADLIAVAAWTALVFAAAQAAGGWLKELTGWGRLALGAALVLALFLLPRLAAAIVRRLRAKGWLAALPLAGDEPERGS